MNNYRLTLSYDGTKYNGWQRLSNTENTIQHKVETTLSRLLEQKIEVSSSGRTDAGVHARRQICSFRAETMLTCEELLGELRRYLPQDIGICTGSGIQKHRMFLKEIICTFIRCLLILRQ